MARLFPFIICIALMLNSIAFAQESPSGATHQPDVAKPEVGHGLILKEMAADDGAYHRVFNNAEGWAKEYDARSRDAWQRPKEIIKLLKISKNDIVADIGAGTGYLSARISKVLSGGKVYAVDAEEDMVRYIEQRSKKESLTNLIPVFASANDPKLPERVDLIIMLNTYRYTGRRDEYFSLLKRYLKPSGRVAIIDFRDDATQGPPRAQRAPKQSVIDELNKSGFTMVESFDALPRQYFMVFKADGF